MKEKKYNGSFIYAIIGVCTLVVAIVGSTYAYLTASISNNTVVTGEASMNSAGVAANNALSLNVTKLSTGANGSLIPISVGSNTTNLNNAAKGWTGSAIGTSWNANYACKDKNGYTVCQIYSVTVTSNLKQIQNIKLGITSLAGTESTNNTPNIDVVKMTNTTTVAAITSIKGSDTGLTSATSIASQGTSSTFYFMVFIRETGSGQDDNGSFSGTITATNSDYGTTITAKFS